MMKMRHGWILALLSLLALPAAAQDTTIDPMTLRPLPRTGDQVEWYTVQPGDTLEGLSLKYLGDARQWQENYRLNPQLRDPNVITPGQKIRLIVGRFKAREAEVTQVARRVESKLFPDQVKDTKVGDRLRERDGVETGVASSAKLNLGEDSNLFIGEKSLIFLQRSGSTLVGVKRDEIEIRSGQAELAASFDAPQRREIEIRIGDTRAVPTPDEAGTARTRARKADTGGAAVMVYGGSSQVEAAGEAVAVAQGMGTTVPEDGPPNPPEKLLPAPQLTTPAAQAHFDYSNPPFTWSPVPGAASYTVEVCTDPECGSLEARAIGIEAEHWLAEPLSVGTLYWRVTAVSPSGLDGYPSPARPFVVDSPVVDLVPPVVVAVREGPGHTHNGTVTLGPGGTLRLESHDDASGAIQIRYRWDDGEWQDYGGEKLTPPTAEATLHALTVDRRGRESAAWSVPVRMGSS